MGADRIITLLVGEDSIREVMAFPKSSAGTDLMLDAPSEIAPAQLADLHLAIVPEEEKAAG